MPTLDWLKKEFHYGYDSGDVERWFPGAVRRREEKAIGGSYRRVFRRAALPCFKPDSTVLEMGPGRGSWSRALIRHLPKGRLITVDFQDVSPWLEPERHAGRLVCHQVRDNSFGEIADDSVDFFWAFGVIVHINQAHIAEILRNLLPKMKPGGTAVFNYADWEKLDAYGWRKGHVPEEFRNLPDDEIWWPRNDRKTMTTIAEEAGWNVVSADLDLVKRDPIIRLRRGQDI